MRRTLFLDPFGGAAGNMLLGALWDAGASEAEIRRALNGLGLPGWHLEVRQDRHQGFFGTRVVVHVDEAAHPARHLRDVTQLLERADLPPTVRARALAVFTALFRAEAAVHGQRLESVHLHEVGAVDAVVDIVGVCAALATLKVERVVCGPVPVGRGSVSTAHGLLPVPPPAVAELLRGVPLAGHTADGEMTTPTGAALLVTLVDSWGPPPSGVLQRVGVGLGTRVFPGVPNLLRAMVLEEGEGCPAERVLEVVETTLDDVPGERIAWLQERVREVGALDVWCLSGTGRKGRPMVELKALCELGCVGAVLEVLFAEGATLGARVMSCRRPELARQVLEVSTAFGTIPVKLGVLNGRVVWSKPEHEVCREVARCHGVPLLVVEEAARFGAPRPGDQAPVAR